MLCKGREGIFVALKNRLALEKVVQKEISNNRKDDFKFKKPSGQRRYFKRSDRNHKIFYYFGYYAPNFVRELLNTAKFRRCN